MIQSVDIAIATWNRATLLERTLESLTALDVPEGVSLSILLVNNNSTDDTKKVIHNFYLSEFGQRHRVVPLTETQQGHTFGRNCAVMASTGDLVLWTDDDVRVSPNWVRAYCDSANDQPEQSFWGAEIQPEFENGKPAWIDENWDAVQGCFATRDLKTHGLEFTKDRLPYGANFAVRGKVQRLFLFETSLGRRRDQVLGEDELELMRRLLASDHRGSWVVDAAVQHFIPADRSTHQYVHDYFVGQGRALAVRGTPWHHDINKLRREARSEYRKYWCKRWWAQSPVWCSHLLRSALAKGQAEGLETNNKTTDARG